jgi:hypothetical protein
MGSRVWESRKVEASAYKRRAPARTPLYRIVYQERENLEREWESRFEPEYGVLRSEVVETLDEYLDCGILAHGCARAECENRECAHTILIPFSCKKRVCPSCAAKRALVFADHLHEEVFAAVPQRHVVFSIPKRLRIYVKYDRSLFDVLFRAGWESIKEFYSAAVPGVPGAVLVAQSAGESLNFNPHLHGCISSGSFDESGNFHPVGKLDTAKLSELFMHKVLSAFKALGLITDTIIAQITSQKHSGFSVWVGEEIAPGDASYRLFLGGYIDRGPVANSRIELAEDIVTYRTDKDNQTHEFSPLEFLARLTPHIAKKWESTVRYMGYYSHRARGARKKRAEQTNPQPVTILPLPEEQQKKASKAWAVLIKRVFELNPLLCERCGSAMKIKEFITDPKKVKRLLESLGIPPIIKPEPIKANAPPDGIRECIFDDLQYV